MKKTILSVALCMFAALTMTAQEVDKAKVTGNADAAAKAGDNLKKLENAEKAWKFDGTVGLNAAATGLVNWAAGGKNNINGIVYAKLHLLYHKDAIAWETNLDTDFGLTWIDQDEDAFQKSSDNIKLATKFGWEFKPTWYLTVLASFQSQYALGRSYETGYNPIISKWLAPSYTDISVGIDWKKSYNGADFSIYLSPVAGRITTAYIGKAWNDKYSAEYDDAMGTTGYNLREELQKLNGTYTYAKEATTIDGVNYAVGDKIYRNARAEFGLSFKGAIAYAYKDFKLSTTLALFSPYQGKGFSLKDIYEEANGAGSWENRDINANYFEYSNNNRFFGMFDVDWDVALSYQFLKCLQVTLQTSLKYYPGTLIERVDKTTGDVSMSERCQFKGVIGLGVGYSF
ncbi:MAG: DUF3078 domain-containing protein [Paludibacteraceae bacterium]|nr:DUF3078 domain-containing protein [Paludibacteraceae bacterium]